MQLENSLAMGKCVHRDYRKEFVKIGESVSIRKPVKFETSDGATLVNQDVEEGNTSITIDKRKHVAWKFTMADMTLKIEEYSERYIKPAMITLANTVDADLCGLYSNVWNWVGTPGQQINSFGDLAQAPERLDELAVPQDMRHAVLGPKDHWGMVSNLTGLYIDRAANEAYRKGSLGNVGGLEMYMDQNIRRHTVGAHGGTPLVDGASQNVTYASVKSNYQQTLVTDGWATSAGLKAGDVFTIDGVFAVNPVSRETLDFLQQFTLVADVTTNANAANDTNLTISPPIITSGPYQTVSAAPANNAPINYLGTAGAIYPQNLVFQKNAFALVTVPIELPDSAGWKSRQTHKGISVRLVKDYNITDDVETIRCDIMYGVKAIYPELAARASGAA